ncbi:NUDIX hydrolase [Glycomyces luteolus]|uniref:NUDIX hydrolase n=1 Tax=Glycomyces luteolus TaxID=2670330 RepID=A0A9X3SQ89_9ACTN|nr:NUDIX hydrolase [Glycomyces luteolus]MDA1358664.1 NUDIX hydrolase [Glycomyces luteolus]
MTDSAPLWERDPAAWEAHLAEGNATQARKRVSADVLIRDPAGRILLVKPTYKPGWDLPGGMCEANESPADAARREINEELGIGIEIGRLLCVEWVPPHGPWDDLLAFIFDGGRISTDAIIHLDGKEVDQYSFCTLTDAQQRLRPRARPRLASSLQAAERSPTAAIYLQNGKNPEPAQASDR